MAELTYRDAVAAADIELSPAEIALLIDSYFVPGWQSLDIGRKDVFGTDRHSHTENRLGKEIIGTGRTGTVNIGKSNDKIVGTLNIFHL